MVAHVVIVHDLGDQHAEQDAAQEIPAKCGQHAGQNNIWQHNLHLSGLGRTVAVLTGNHADGCAGQAKGLTDLIFQITLV